MKLLRERVALEIDRASQYDSCVGSLFELELNDSELDPDLKKYKDFLLKCADRIIKMVEKDRDANI